MRITQFVRRGLVASAAIATLSTGFAGAANAQVCGSAGFTPGGDPVVVNAPGGYTCELVHTPGIGETAVLAIGTGPGSEFVVVEFRPDVFGPTVVNVGSEDVAAYGG
jgi:hypothetical protein